MQLLEKFTITTMECHRWHVNDQAQSGARVSEVTYRDLQARRASLESF